MPHNPTSNQGRSEASSRQAVYVISVAAELAGVHPQTLRIYERKGLLDPTRTRGGNRRYSDFDIAQLQRIQDLTNAGVNLEGVRRLLQAEAERQRLLEELAEARAQIAAALRQHRRDLVPLRTGVLPIAWKPRPRQRSNQ